MQELKVKVTKAAGKFGFDAINAAGSTLTMDCSKASGGDGYGASPIDLLLMSLGGCSGIDIVSILSKQQQTLEHIEVDIVGKRDTESSPGFLVEIEAQYETRGDVCVDKVLRAVQLSMEKYCTVGRTLESKAQISYALKHNGVQVPISKETAQPH